MDTLRAENERLRKALKIIAGNPVTGEDASTKHSGTYDALVKLARAALSCEIRARVSPSETRKQRIATPHASMNQ